MRYMADSTVCSQIPASIAMPGRGVQPISLRAGYLGGSYQKSSHACGPVDVEIDVDATHPYADVLDIETGDATPDSAPQWVINHKAQVTEPAVLYCNRSTIHAVANACAAKNLLPNKDFFWWISTLDGTTSVADMTGVVAIQAWSANYFPGHNIDVSIVYDDTWKAGTMPTAQDIANAVLNSQVTFTRPDNGQTVTNTVAVLLAWTNWYSGLAESEIRNLPADDAVAIVNEFAKRVQVTPGP